jgi:hypothetical protein
VGIWPTRGSEEAFARAIRGQHPTIQRFAKANCFQFDSFGIIASALASLPALESASLYHDDLEEEDGEPLEDLPAMEHPEHTTTLLLSPSLRSVEFEYFHFPNSVCQAVALPLKTGSPITYLKLTGCDFSEGGGGAIVHSLQRNTTLKTPSLICNEDHDGNYDALTTVLLVNTTLTDLSTVRRYESSRSTWLHPFFVALRINTSLKKLDVSFLSLADELVFGALCEVFAKNSVLEELTLYFGSDFQTGETDVASWRRTLPFLRDNKTLKSFTSGVNVEVVGPHAIAICIDTVAMLGYNDTLEVLDIRSRGLKLNNYFSALESLQTNTTLKTLRLNPQLDSISDAEMHRFISLVKKNYGLEKLDQENSVPSCD